MSGFYVAMGSSFGAGPGLRPRDSAGPRLSGRSQANYAHLVAANRGLNLRDVTYSGETVHEFLHGTRHRRAAQIDAVQADTSLVTITGGGNDVGYLPGLTLASLPAPLGLLLGRDHRLNVITEPALVDERFRRLETDLVALVDRIHERAPQARIMLVDYLTILPPAPFPAPPLPDSVADWGRKTAARLSETFSRVAAHSAADYLPVAAVSKDHHAWSADPWTRRFHYSLRGGAPYHPNAKGMSHVAQFLTEQLTTERTKGQASSPAGSENQ